MSEGLDTKSLEVRLAPGAAPAELCLPIPVGNTTLMRGDAFQEAQAS